jgi:hypothetical protein
LDLTEKFLNYVRVIRRPFKDVDLTDWRAVASAFRLAKTLGKPMSDELIEFCEINEIPVSLKILKAHENKKYIIDFETAS